MTGASDATRAQNRAAGPDRSVWVSANAGSGKTKVLTDRVARLLLAGTEPQRILCLTYTKAAATEMQNRLFARLGSWAMLDDATLTERLLELGEATGRIDAERLRRARTLFARALETPGGLKIQTIHSFCAALLRRFPLEAGVSPRFAEMEERAGKRLRAEIVEDLATTHRAVFDAIAAHGAVDEFDKLLLEITRQAEHYAHPPDAAAIHRTLGLPEGFTEVDLVAGVFTGGEAELTAGLVPMLAAGSSNDQRDARKLGQIDMGRRDVETVAALEDVFLYAGGQRPDEARLDRFPTKQTREQPGLALGPLQDLMRRTEWARPRRRALAAAGRSLALHRFAHLFTAEYTRRKQAQGWLDFDDQILRARALLSSSAVAQWVLFRLDGGLDHILVDEAQDTSPAQWDVIWKLAEEFTAGAGARQGVERTVFVVGDEKQSIYSFQGADPAVFGEMQDRFRDHLAAIGPGLERVNLHFSFRSAGAVLRVVDHTFSGETAAGVGREVTHRAFKGDLPGRVDIWPFIEKGERTAEPNWYDPVDTLAEDDPAIRLAAQIADTIRDMIDAGVQIPWADREGSGARPLRPGDILILVQRRSEIFHEIIRKLKEAGLPVAGADRLRIGGELAVKDLTALLAFLATPEDDLSLAAALRSPLFGLSEGDLYDLAHGRPGYLWHALRDRAAEFAEAHATLVALRDRADFLRPYELLERILTRHGGRARLLARLGPEAEDGIDALLSQALAYERAEVPSLVGFLGWLGADETQEIKRELDSAGDQIRVMSVHGAKGLEAPVVILPDTAKRKVDIKQKIFALPDGSPGWLTATGDAAAPLAEARDALKTRQIEERRRLLYVAMTRAESWLIVCGAGDPGKAPIDSWYNMARAGVEAAGAVTEAFAPGAGLRFGEGDWPEPAAGPQAGGADLRALLARLGRGPRPAARGGTGTGFALGSRRCQGAARRVGWGGSGGACAPGTPDPPAAGMAPRDAARRLVRPGGGPAGRGAGRRGAGRVARAAGRGRGAPRPGGSRGDLRPRYPRRGRDRGARGGVRRRPDRRLYRPPDHRIRPGARGGFQDQRSGARHARRDAARAPAPDGRLSRGARAGLPRPPDRGGDPMDTER